MYSAFDRSCFEKKILTLIQYALESVKNLNVTECSYQRLLVKILMFILLRLSDNYDL